jgi:serine phosphatase RsbU (regulator of sigma subunit)
MDRSYAGLDECGEGSVFAVRAGRTLSGQTGVMSQTEPAGLLHASPAALPGRIAASAEAAAGCKVGVYVIDIDGSCLIRLGADDAVFPERIKAPIGVGPEIALEQLPTLEQICASRLPSSAVAAMIVRDRAIGALVCEREPDRDLRPLAGQAAIALELTSGYTDVLHAARRRKEIQPAAEIQQDLLPPRLAVFDGDELAGGVLPGYDLAGDFFDYASNADGLWLCVADAMGKGNDAAALSSLAVGALRAARRGGANLEQAAGIVHRTVAATGSEEVRFLTAVLAQWHADTSTFQWISAGHPPPLLLRADGAVEELTGAGTFPLGVPDDVRTFTTNRRRLGRGERLLLYSDGVTERRRTDGTFLGLEGLLSFLRTARATSAAEIVRGLHDVVLGASPKPLRDDATMLLLAPADSSAPAR